MSAQTTMCVCELLLKLYHLHQRFLSRGATEALAAALGAPHVKWRARDLADILSAVRLTVNLPFPASSRSCTCCSLLAVSAQSCAWISQCYTGKIG